MISVGVLGGSFDPVHFGHIELACRAGHALGLDRVLLVPCSDPPHKPGRALAARYHRLEMLYLAVEGRPGIEVSTFEIAKVGFCYTIDTLRALRSGKPPLAPVFLCGSDALGDIESWREHEALLSEFDFAAVVRQDDSGRTHDPDWPETVRRREAPRPPPGEPPPGAGGRVFRLDVPTSAVSSSLVRSRRASGSAIDDLVPVRVARYIQRHRLYTQEAAR